MNNPALANVIAAFRAAEAAIPETAPDAVMDAAVALASDFLAAAIAVPSHSTSDVIAKLTLADALVEWSVARAELIARAIDEQAALEANREEAEAMEWAGVIAASRLERRHAA